MESYRDFYNCISPGNNNNIIVIIRIFLNFEIKYAAIKYWTRCAKKIFKQFHRG